MKKMQNIANRTNELRYIFLHEDYKDLNINQKINARSHYILKFINNLND